MSSGVLHHFAFDPASRAVRIALGEAKVAVEENAVRPWEPDCVLRELNPSGMPPVLSVDGLMLREQSAILGWLEDRAGGPFLLPADPSERAEARRLVQAFDRRFTDEVDAVLLHERLEKPLLRMGPPEARALREGRENLKHHLSLLEDLLASRDCLAGRRLSQADVVGAAHLSVLDFFGEIAWASWPGLKTWYMRIKSRPSLRPLLSDRLPGLAPAPHYADLDF